MNAAQAKQVPMALVLARRGFQPTTEKGDDLWYCSPFRKESEPSFKINVAKNIWYDHGAGKGGNVLDFVMQYHELDSVADALRTLRNEGGPAPHTTSAQPPSRMPTSTKKSDMEVEKVQPLSHPKLIRYLDERAIPRPWAQRYLNEIYYTVGDKLYYALGFASDSGGYELRNPYFKGAIGTKDITVIQPEGEGDYDGVVVFEGFMDFLSALVHFNKPSPDIPVVIMNSVALKDRVMDKIRSLDVQTARLFLDRDASGQELTAYMQTQLPECNVIDASTLYEGYKDFNELLVAQHQARSR